ncbi:MAG TPA: amidohydrolase family protein, partial [Cyclobacteriaceae bacterium]|nr:amidohydrolase family protein [Cyclobacteriaceae bacterium]
MKRIALLLIVAFACLQCSPPEKVDLLLSNGKIWTGNSEQPWAEWVAVKDGRIHSVGSAQPFKGEATNTIDLKGRLTLPGFNDSHVHFASAGHLLLNINLLDVNSTDRFIENVKQTTERLPAGSWITRGDWGAYEAWSMGSAGGKSKAQFTPNRKMIDSITAQHPVLVTR